MFLYRYGAAGRLAAGESPAAARILLSDPFSVPPERWELGRPVDLSAVPLAPPAHPGKIVGIGRNYREHAAELGNPMPPEPLLFLKAPTSLIGHGAAVILPPESERVEYEGEIAVVVGRRLQRASEEEARAGLFGVTCACDVTARDLQRKDATFARGKSFDTFCPLGPVLVTTDEIPDPGALSIRTDLNGEVVQDWRTDDMIFDVPDLIAFLSAGTTLLAGTVILTGTPHGVGMAARPPRWLAPGDEVAVTISGIGTLRNAVVAEG